MVLDSSFGNEKP
ncbi:hypothetical protein SAMN04488049_102448 [Tritonibacter multivorans]|nr:hypothetical protein SAMN04488049_102448 [Tritonibacter multivorans]